MLNEIEDKNIIQTKNGRKWVSNPDVPVKVVEKKSKKDNQEALLNVDSYLFKTWIFGNKPNPNDDRYKTFEDAINGHNMALLFFLDKMKNSGILG